MPPFPDRLPEAARLQRLRFQLWRIEVAGLTTLATVWAVMLGPLPGIAALLIAKHVLVALLLARPEEEDEDAC